MESPVVIENCANFATPLQTSETGFPFDDSDYDSNDHFEARLNDLAQRHPEFADHLMFPSLRRKRYGSGSSTDQDESRSQSNKPSTSSSQFNPDSRRFGDHSFPSGFNRFPFSRHFEDFVKEPRRDDKPPEVPKTQEKRGRKPNPYLPQHLSNTVDLGQKQTPVEEKRSQRSMSAPPENRSAQNITSPRVDTESLNAQQTQEADMGKTFSRQSPSQQPQQASQPRERIIPIHVEGRDDPVIPKNTNTTGSEKGFGGERVQHPGYQQYPHPNQYQRQHQQPQFAKHGFYESFAEPAPSAAKHYQHNQQTPFSKQTTPPSQQGASAPPREPSPTQIPTTAQQPAAAPPLFNDPLEKIKCVRNDVMELMNQVETFAGTKKDRKYLYLDEMLTRNLLKLDNIETEGKDNIRQARREAIKCIQTCINKLEAKAQEMGRKSAEMAQESMESPGESLNANADAPAADQEQKVEEDELAKPVFKSEATLVISGKPATISQKPDASAETSLAACDTMEVESKQSETVTSVPVEQQTASSSEAAPSTVLENNVEPIKNEPSESTNTETGSSQSNETAATQ